MYSSSLFINSPAGIFLKFILYNDFISSLNLILFDLFALKEATSAELFFKKLFILLVSPFLLKTPVSPLGAVIVNLSIAPNLWLDILLSSVISKPTFSRSVVFTFLFSKVNRSSSSSFFSVGFISTKVFRVFFFTIGSGSSDSEGVSTEGDSVKPACDAVIGCCTASASSTVLVGKSCASSSKVISFLLV